MSETKSETEFSKNKFSRSLIEIGNKLKDASDQEVPNKKVIASLAMIGAAGVCTVVASTIQGSRMSELAHVLQKFAENASNAGHHVSAIGLYNDSISSATKAMEAFKVSTTTSFLLATEAAVIGGVQVAKNYLTSDGLLNFEGKTKISTIGSALGDLFVKVGNHFDKG